MQNISSGVDHYDELVARQIEQYRETEEMHNLPPIYRYFSEKHLRNKSTAVTGSTDVISFYADYFRKSLRESDSIFLMSIGSGDCSIEIGIVKNLIATKENFFFICLELSPILIAKARKRIDEESLGDLITVAQIDLNKWEPKNAFAGVMAHHSLHHFLNLEQLFALIKKNLAPHGRFVTCDIIGRNGHMRWPETLALTRKIWEQLPRKYKYNHQFHRYEDYFNNFDCSTEGFEGIRAQDILPLLVKQFSFEVFFSYGNLIDPFIDRNFGPNYDPADPQDTAFIDYVQALNEKLISEEILKPTIMSAVMVNDPVGPPGVYAHWGPVFAIRDPEAPAPDYEIAPLLKSMPLRATREDDPLVIRQAVCYPLGQKAVFGTSESLLKRGAVDGRNYLTYGWSSSEEGLTWSNCEDAGLIFPLEKEIVASLALTLEFIYYQSPLHKRTLIEVWVNGSRIDTLEYANAIPAGLSTAVVQLPGALLRERKQLEIAFRLPCRRQPQFEPGDDLRPVGIALTSATLSVVK